MKIKFPVIAGAAALAMAAAPAESAPAGGPVQQLRSTAGPAAHQPLRVAHAAQKPKGKSKAKGLTKQQVLGIVKTQIAKAGTRGPTGPAGPAGSAGPTGPAGSVTGIPIQKISFKSNQGSTIQIPFDGPGMKLEAECASSFQLRFRAEEAKGVVHAFAVGDGGVTYSAGFETVSNSALDLVPNGEAIVSGKLEFTQFATATNVTINYLAAYGSSQGDCVFTGTIVQA